jgi:hypothetical protein
VASLLVGGNPHPRTVNRTLIHWSQGVRHRAEHGMALRWWQQSQTVPLGHQAALLSYVCLPPIHTSLYTWWPFNSPISVGLIWTTYL